MDKNIHRLTALPGALDTRLASIDRSLERIAGAMEGLVDVVRSVAETQSAVEALVGVVGKLADQ
ncbi:hypothetical protein HK104_007896, partial [Borealophlyctis nickersoniae]